MGLVRTQLLSPDDLDKVKEIQAGYKARPLSVYAGTASPPAPTPLEWPPISDEKVTTDFWPLAAFLLQFAPPLEGEDGLRDSFSRLGLKAGESWPPKDLPSETVTLMRDLVGPTEQEIRETSWRLTDSSKIFGTPEFMKGRYLDRAAAALGGIYGNSVEEALYVIYGADTEGAPLDGKTRKYALRFTPATLPPVDAFWSITMYDKPKQLLVANPINRYLINSPMLSGLKANDKGEIVIYLRHETPGTDLESNWLPADATLSP
jgi:hypothetical protein